MPPRVKPGGSSSKDLVPVGKRDVFVKNPSKPEKQEKGPKPTTERALILRNGKYGSQGTGELILMSRMTGREKMDLLAENLVEESKKAILTPFRLETCLKNAESQSDSYVDDIANLRDPDLFRHIIEAELNARTEPTRDPRRNPSYVAKLVANKIHNTYMLASAWKIVSDSLNDLAIDGVTDKNIKNKLKSNSDIRERYLVIYDMVRDLVMMSQSRFAVLATTTPHYARFFKLKSTESSNPNEPEYIFDWKDLREAGTSFLDSIIIELCFPKGAYPQAVLFQILHDAIEESPRDAKRFPQALWDAVGDLSRSVELQEILSAPLFGPEGDEWKKSPRVMPEVYEKWVDAQILSDKATNMSANFKDMLFPIEKTRNKSVLEKMWNQINDNYTKVSGEGIDSLWQLEGVFDYAPQWSSIAPKSYDDFDDSPSDIPNGRSAIVKRKKKPMAITSGDSDSNDSMPGLQSVSNTSDDDEDEDDDSEEEEEEGDSSDDDSGYNTEEEDEIRELWREAMDVAHEADFFDASTVQPEINPFSEEDRKGNPFLKMLGSLRGRMFSSSSKLKTTTRTEPRTTATRGAFRATPSGVPKEVPKTMPPKPTPAPPKPASTPTAQPPKNMKATVEDVEDDDDASAVEKKKKKKKPKKKKKIGSTEDSLGSSPSVQSFATAEQSFSAPSPTVEKKVEPPISPRTSTSSTLPFGSSTTSLPLGTPAAQSARSYLQSLGIKTEKKIKSRPDHASLFSNTTPAAEPKKKSFFSKVTGAGKENEQEKKESSGGWFKKLTKKTEGLMHQLLKTEEDTTDGRAPMKWEHFLKLMREMGFEYDPSTAGSSVRFDPPNKNDRPITFHKPHPDPTLQPIMLKEFAKKLKRYYGWNEQDLLRV